MVICCSGLKGIVTLFFRHEKRMLHTLHIMRRSRRNIIASSMFMRMF